MIIFYQKSTGNIVGTIDGRVHTPEQQIMTIAPENIPKEDIGKYEVPTTPRKEMRETPVYEFKQKPGSTSSFVRVMTGTRMEEQVVELLPTGPLGELVRQVETGAARIYEHKILHDGKNVTGAEKIVEKPNPAAVVDEVILDLSLTPEELRVQLPQVVQLSLQNTSPVEVKEVQFKERAYFLHVVDNSVMSANDKDIAHRLCAIREPFLSGEIRLYMAHLPNNEPVAACMIRAIGNKYVYYLGEVLPVGVPLYAFENLIWQVILDAKELGLESIDIGAAVRHWSSSID